MTCRVDTTLIAGACVVGDRGLGMLGSVIRATTGPGSGPHGAGYLYNDWQDSSDDGKEFRGLIVAPPAAGTFAANEDGSFSLTGAPDGGYSFTYRLYVDGADLGTATASVTIGTQSAITAAVSGLAAIAATGAVVASVQTPPVTDGSRALLIASEFRGFLETHSDRPISPGATLDWAWDWSAWLAVGDSIVSQQISASDMLTPAAPALDGARVTAFIACAADAPIASRQHATCAITTAAGRVDSRTIRFIVAAR